MFRKLRLQLKMSQHAYAKELHISQTYVSQIEWGDRNIRPLLAQRMISLAKKHGINLSFEDIYNTPPQE